MITSLCLCYIIIISSIEYICCDLHLCKFTHGYLGDEFTLYMSCYSTAKGKPNQVLYGSTWYLQKYLWFFQLTSYNCHYFTSLCLTQYDWLSIAEVHGTTVSTRWCGKSTGFCCSKLTTLLFTELSIVCWNTEVHENHQEPNSGISTNVSHVLSTLSLLL